MPCRQNKRLAPRVDEFQQLSCRRSGSRRHSRQRFLKRVGDRSVWRAVCWMFRWPRCACEVRVFGAQVGKLKAAGVPEHVLVSLKAELGRGGFRRDVPGCLLLGLRHGAYCVGCCWALMALLFVGGVMNLFWIVLLSLTRFLGEGHFLGPPSPCRHSPHRGRCMVVVNGNVLTAWTAATGPPQFLDPLDLVGAGEVARAAGTMEKSGGGTATERLT